MASLLLLTMAAAWSLQRMTDAAQEQRHVSTQRLLVLEKTLNSLHKAETAQRGYLITANARHLEGWEKSTQEARQYHATLVAMYAGDPTAAKLLESFGRWERLKLEDLEDSIQAQRDVGRDVAETLAHADNGRHYMVQINKIIGQLEALEADSNAALQKLVARRRAATYGAALVLFLVASVASVLVWRLLRREAAARQALHERMAHDAFHDALTLLPNRRYLLEELERAVMRARRQHRLAALLFIDLDGFKRVNDSLGHEAGDALLQRVSERFARTVRQSDLLARLGGDEFAVVLDADSRISAAALGERLIEAIRGPLIDGHADVLVSASIGIALFPEDAPDSSTLLARADQAMYLAKRLGKSRVASLPAAIEPERKETLPA
ncbi:diguanylate cyclase domain-containing protein [Piscinibacter terrae]|nr:diguanylate cyclase [Albitalea terrae]